MLIVQKYGGTSLGDAEKIGKVATRVVRSHRGGNQVVVVVSAMGDTTDNLIALAHEVSDNPSEYLREMDMLLTSGERISMALLAIAVRERGLGAVSLTGEQAGILTDSSYGNAKILGVQADRVLGEIAQGNVVVVAGFQGVTNGEDVTTLGRGGSDTTAVALAHALHADACEIYTDVDGVYTADPRVVSKARKLKELTFLEMLEMSATGAGVLAERAVEYARRYGIPIHIRSSFKDDDGTWIRETTMEKPVVSGVTYDTSETKLTISDVPDEPGMAGLLMGALADTEVIVDMTVQNVSRDGVTDISLTVPKSDGAKALRAVSPVAESIGATVDLDPGIAKVSIVGAGMKFTSDVLATALKTLGSRRINVEMISTSPIRFSFIVRRERIEEAVKALHDVFNPPMMPAEEVGTE